MLENSTEHKSSQDNVMATFCPLHLAHPPVSYMKGARPCAWQHRNFYLLYRRGRKSEDHAVELCSKRVLRAQKRYNSTILQHI
ncbi:hypothetical protein GDO81_011684 [Engystomops pustulosus]|uniref:Uncharacterized protein n=1 Tax=Engystomops pustulosus TaxID=76066 RepID=A0AAV7BGG7_ENGPU|nr:hypothetical protein GDO81_011684 [Engystomops pustulosus]